MAALLLLRHIAFSGTLTGSSFSAHALSVSLRPGAFRRTQTKSETFSADPFEYEFMYAPMGDDSVYEYVELWYGFAVKKGE